MENTLDKEKRLILQYVKNYTTEVELGEEYNIYTEIKNKVTKSENLPSNNLKEIAFNTLVNSLYNEIIFAGVLIPGILSLRGTFLKSSFSKLLDIGVLEKIISKDDAKNASQNLNDEMKRMYG